jgi:hypothetical protein
MINVFTPGMRIPKPPYPVRFPTVGSCCDPPFTYREELLQFIWEQGLFQQEELRTVDGRLVEVVRAGRRQFNSGPDLLDALVRIGDQLWAGTVEVHVRASEWVAHGHHTDPAYDNVVLHVVWVHDAEVRTKGGVHPPVVVLQGRVDQGRMVAFEELLRRKAWVSCAGQVEGVLPTVIDRALEQALQHRLDRKVGEVLELLRKLGNDPLSALHHLLLRALGGKVNAEPFDMLAHALPIRMLLKVRDDAVRTEALLFGQAGLLQGDMADEHPRLLQREHAHLARTHGLLPVPLAAWKFGRLRPAAFPTLRIAQYARLIMRQGDDLMRLLECDDLSVCRSLLEVEAGPYWDMRYRFDRPSPMSVKRLGDDAVDHVLINAVIPLRMALGRAHGRSRLVEGGLGLLGQLPAERNVILRNWSRLGVHALNAARSQALIEHTLHSCAHRQCLTCAIGQDLLQRTSS